MDRMKDSGSFGCSSILHGGTKKVDNLNQLSTFFILIKQALFHEFNIRTICLQQISTF